MNQQALFTITVGTKKITRMLKVESTVEDGYVISTHLLQKIAEEMGAKDGEQFFVEPAKN